MIYSVFSLRIRSASVLLQSSVLIDLWETVVKLTESAGAQPYVPCTKSMCSDERIQIVKRIIYNTQCLHLINTLLCTPPEFHSCQVLFTSIRIRYLSRGHIEHQVRAIDVSHAAYKCPALCTLYEVYVF